MDWPAVQGSHVAKAPSGVKEAGVSDLIEAAKLCLPVPFRDDGPPLGFEFDPVPVGKRAELENMAKKRMVIGDYDAEAAADGSIHVGVRHLGCGSCLFW